MLINILNYFEDIVYNNKDRIAVVDGEKRLTFAQLMQKSKTISEVISGIVDGKRCSPVAVYINKSESTVIANLGILYSGNAYMNLDIKTPINRIHNIIKLIEPACIITNEKNINALEKIYPSEKIINIDAVSFENSLEHRKIFGYETLIDVDPCCIINTSGSTGVPKGVVLNHRSFIDFITWANESTGIHEGEIIGSLSPAVFDIYSFELCMMMSGACTIVIIPDKLSAFPIRILELMAQQKVSFIFWVPTIMVNIANLELLTEVSLPDLRMVWFAGEVFPTKQFNTWRRSLPAVQFINLNGPIEITLDCTYYIVERELDNNEPIPICTACKNTDILILNEAGRCISAGEEGELCVRGTSLAMGYFNNPEKTAAAFVQNPLNKSYPELIYRTGDIATMNERGEIIFKGRRDTLVKHGGYRIELAEIEHVIVNTLQLVSNGCVIYDHKNKEIVLFYESAVEQSVAEMRKVISSVFPKYMIPTKYAWYQELPRNTNGKIDRLKLKELLNEQNH